MRMLVVRMTMVVMAMGVASRTGLGRKRLLLLLSRFKNEAQNARTDNKQGGKNSDFHLR